jgi:hypothetical protein
LAEGVVGQLGRAGRSKAQQLQAEDSHDRLSDLARLGGPFGDHHMGGSIVSAVIIPFTRGRQRNSERSEFSAIAFRSAERPDDLVIDHVDAAACEGARFESQSGTFGDG